MDDWNRMFSEVDAIRRVSRLEYALVLLFGRRMVSRDGNVTVRARLWRGRYFITDISTEQ
jgi:hypothetical protein